MGQRWMQFELARKPYDFQRDGVRYLVTRGGGFLWDEPGLGKTTQAIIAAAVLGGPVLVICPNSLKRMWRKEILATIPSSRVVISGRGGRFGHKNVQRLPADVSLPLKVGDKEVAAMLGSESPTTPLWVIVHYEGVRLNIESLSRVAWSIVITDECHYIKNRNAARTKSVMAVTPADAYRIGLTATPFGKNPADLWAQLRWMAPEVRGLKSYWRFHGLFTESEMSQNFSGGRRYLRVIGGRNLDLLAKVMSGYGLQRLKRDVAKQLPPITDTEMPITINGSQLDTYKVLRRKSAVEVDIPHGDGITHLVIVNALARLIRMQQWLSHPWAWNHQMIGCKMEWLIEWAAGFNQQAVIATRFKESSRGVAKHLGERCKAPVTGDIHVTARDAIIKDWENGEHQFLVGTIDTIGVGLSLTPAHCLVCYDQLYDPIKMDQLRQRVHRITTDHPVQVIYLYCEGTVDEVVLNSFKYKWSQMELVRNFLRHIQEERDDSQR